MIKIVVDKNSNKELIDFTESVLSKNDLDYTKVQVEPKGSADCGFSFVPDTPYIEFPNSIRHIRNQEQVQSFVENFLKNGHPNILEIQKIFVKQKRYPFGMSKPFDFEQAY